MDGFNTVVKFFLNQKSTIGYSFMALLTVGGERIFSMVSFQCPCNKSQNFNYGLVFIVGPALVLFIIGYFVSSRTWKLFTGCCLNPRKLCPRRNSCYCVYVFAQITVEACIPPVMWLTVALLNGTFYECAVSGLENNHVVDLFCKGKTDECRVELPRVPCGKSSLSSADNQELLLMLRAQSQILGWLIVCIAAVTGLIGTCYKNCRSQVSYLQLKFWRKYIEKEKEQFDCFATEYATKLADRNLKSFFENTEPEAFPFPSHSSWEEISSLYTFCKSEQYYSTLQRTVEKGNKDKDDEMRCALDFVDGVEMM
ncbi:calcium homeostasis modulator protein 5-like [Acipenser oxyrinchus oxyrinchus]|uniref:Calcium homeostasis modulator protein 5-like n=1 Tax=Acipenser oxyrinchus oxyrinchus TaxID=40147 RepID=A0AAD8G9T2_ACIOX|nr:calcium homeostasis modulator protein 5-like [Acipenser oxyrinchus oxyrinchus]